MRVDLYVAKLQSPSLANVLDAVARKPLGVTDDDKNPGDSVGDN